MKYLFFFCVQKIYLSWSNCTCSLIVKSYIPINTIVNEMAYIYCFTYISENLLQRNFAAEVTSTKLFKRLWLEINHLRSSDICTGPSTSFIIDKTLFDEEDSHRMEPFIIIGRLLPHSSIYNGREYKIEISSSQSYPFLPPIVRFLTPIYHPNVDESGK